MHSDSHFMAPYPNKHGWISVVISIKSVPSGKRLHDEVENHHVSWENPLFLWSFWIANCNLNCPSVTALGQTIDQAICLSSMTGDECYDLAKKQAQVEFRPAGHHEIKKPPIYWRGWICWVSHFFCLAVVSFSFFLLKIVCSWIFCF